MLQLRPLLNRLTIKTKDLEFVKLNIDVGDYAWSQAPFVNEIERQYNEGKPVRLLTLKARQLGISTASEGVLYNWGFIHPGTNGLVLANLNSTSLELFQMTKLYWETWPFRKYYNLKYSTKQQMHWEETRSRLTVGTAKNLQSGRGATYHAVHATEAAFYPDPETLFLGLDQTVPDRHGSVIIIESTANGMGNWFSNMWEEAEEGGNQYTPMFFPWWRHPEYRMHTTISTKSELDADERQLLRLGASFQNIAWRRWALINKAHGDLAFFMQEYPATPEEAFITTGRPIFSHIHLKLCYDKLPGVTGRLVDDPRGKAVFVKDPSGPLTIFKAPKKGDRRSDRYFCAGDPSETIAGDPACMQVINRQTLEQVAVWHGRVNPIHFGYEMMRVGRFYNECMLCPEIEGGGQATVATILAHNYPNVWLDKRADRVKGASNIFGWSTNFQRKQWCIGTLQRCVLDQSIIIHDVITYNQLRNYVEHDDGYWGNNDKKVHDDAVMALSIGVTASETEGPFMPDVPNSSPIYDLYAQEFEGLGA